MWFNSREQKQTEILQLELARDWAQRNTPLILTLIDYSTQKALLVLDGNETDAAWDLKRLLTNPNVHQRPVCHPVIENIPVSALAPGMRKEQFRTIYVHTDHMVIGYTHSDIALGDVHVDPTFGQFFPEDFGFLVNLHPELFINGILVARTKDIQRAFDVKYE